MILRRLVWTYFFLLIFEGALRKWVLPFAATPLLIVRDPVVIAAYFVAWRSNLFPRNSFITAAALLSTAMFVAGMIASGGNWFITLYGWRADFLHLPFIFLMGRVFTPKDVQRVGYWVLLMALPMAVLMAVQFRSPPNSFINAGSDENFKQITLALGHIRAPGTFSFILGPVYFFTVATVFLLHSQYKSRYPLWLTASATVALMIAMVVSGSRALVLSVSIVFTLAVLVCAVLKPALSLKWVGALAVFAVLGLALSDTPLIQEGLNVFSTRVEGAGYAESRSGGFFQRILNDFLIVVPALNESPELGVGLGLGTNVGSALLTGRAQFLVAEAEWPRVVYESGPILGTFFLAFRIVLLCWLGKVCIQHAMREDPLPLLFFGGCFSGILTGTWGQSTVLGFVIFISGLALASAKSPRRTVERRRLHNPRHVQFAAPALPDENQGVLAS